MAVEVVNKGSLGFVSTLDNSDFQAKSLQDIKLIQLRLQLTGDTSGIEKYDTALKQATANEVQLRAELAKMLADAKVQTEEFSRAVQKPAGRTIFSDSAAEVQAYKDQLVGLESADAVLAKLSTEMQDVVFEQQQYNELLAAGSITQDQYTAKIQALAIEEQRLQQNIQQVTDNFAAYTASQAEIIPATERVNQETEIEIGLLENLKTVLKELKAENLTIIDETALAKSNARIQELEAEISRLSNVGKVGFDEFGIKIRETNTEAAETVGLINTLNTELQALKSLRPTIIDPAVLASTNAQIEALEVRLAQLNNIGRTGFDALGNAAPVNRFSLALSRVSDFGALAGRAITQLTRQVVSLAVGFASFYIGAKAIEALIDYVKNLDYFTGRLDQAKHNLEAFNQVQEDANREAGKTIASLKTLYDTATDVNVVYEERLKAAQALKNNLPNELAYTSAIELANNKLKISFDELTISIVKQAQARSINNKLGDLAGKILDEDLQIQKINNARANELSRVNGVISGGSGGTGGTGGVISEDLQKANINNRADAAVKKIQQDKDQLLNTSKFLVSFANQNGVYLAGALDSNNKLLDEPLDAFDEIIKKASDKKDLEIIKSSLETKLQSLAPNDSQIAVYKEKIGQVEKILEQYSISGLDKKGQSAVNKLNALIKQFQDQATSLANQQKNIQQKVDDILNVSKGENSGNEEQAAVAKVDKQFKDLELSINQANKKYDDFVKNANSKGLNGRALAQAAGLSKIDPDQLVSPLTDAENNARLGVQNDNIKKDLDTKKKLYEDYEAYRLKVGSTIADAEYKDLISGGKTYADYLQNQKQALQNQNNYQKYPNQSLKGLIDQNEIFKKAIDENNQVQKKAFEDLLIQTATYQEKRENIVQAGIDAEKKLNDAGFADRANQVKRDTQNQLNQLNIAQFKTLASYKAVFENIGNLTRQQTKKNLGDLYSFAAAQLASGKISLDAFLQIINQLNKAAVTLSGNGTAATLKEIGAAFGEISTAIGSANQGLANMISTAGNTLNSLAKIKELGDKIQENQGSGLFSPENLGSTLGLITAGISGVTSVINLLSSTAKERKDAEKAYYDAVIAGQREYNLSLIDQIQLQAQLNQNILLGKDYRSDILAATKSLSEANKDYTASLADLQNGQAKVGTKNAVSGSSILSGAGSGALAGAAVGSLLPGVGTLVGGAVGGVAGAIAGLFGGKKPKDVYQPLLDIYPDLIDKSGKLNEARAKELVENNLVSDSTKELLNNSIAYYDKVTAAQDQINSDIKDLAGSLNDDLRNALVTAFEDGTDAAKAFGDSVSKVIENIVSQFLFQDIFGDQFDKLQAKLKASFGIGGDQNATDDLTDFFKNASPLVDAYEQALQAVKDAGAANGLDLFQGNTDTSSNSASGGIQKSITEDTAQRLGGALNGIQLNTSITNNILQGQALSIGQLLILAQDQLNNLIQIQLNTKVTADNSTVLPLMLGVLKSVDKNTGDSAGIAARAAGFYKY